jgi:hypothetical protein
MTNVPTVGDRAEINAIEQELNRTAWNLPRVPSQAAVRISPGSRRDAERESAVTPLRRGDGLHDASGAARYAIARDGLDWQGFDIQHCPERRLHEFEAITTYAGYKRRGEVAKVEATER